MAKHAYAYATVVQAATVLPVSVAQAKLHLRVDESAEDDLIERLIKSAANEIEGPNGWLGRSLMQRSLRLVFDSDPPAIIELPHPPVSAVTEIKYLDGNNVWQTLASTEYAYDLSASPARLWPVALTAWPVGLYPTPDAFRVTYTAGYATAAAIPSEIVQWLLLRVGELYRDREASVLGATTARLSHADRMLDGLRVRA